MTDWFYAIDGDSRGPVSGEEITALIQRRRIVPETLLWHAGMDEWQQAREHFGFTDLPPPLASAAPPRDFTAAIRICFQKYATFQGRASRSEFWFFMLFTWLVSAAIELVTGQSGIIGSLFSLAVFLPSLAVSVRRLHDTGRTGWWLCGGLAIIALSIPLLILFISHAISPVFGPSIIGLAWLAYWVILVVFFCQRGETKPNRFD